MQFTIRSQGGETAEIDAPDWLVAMSKASDLFGLDTSAFGEWLCRSEPDGTIVVEDQRKRRSWMITRVAPKLTIVAVGAATPEAIAFADDLEEVRREPEPEPVFTASAAPPPVIAMPVVSTLKKEEPIFSEEEIAERLFELTFDIAGADEDEACRITLDHVASFVECPDMNVIRGTLNDERMHVLVGRGALGEKLVGTQIEFGVGVIARCTSSGMVVDVREVDDKRLAHLPVDVRPQVRSLLCLPVVNNDGWTFGVIQLLNPPELEPAQVDIAAALARTLGATLARGI